MNKKLALLLSAAMLTSTALSSCGGNSATSPTPTPSKAADATPAPATNDGDTVAVEGEGGEVLLWNQIFEEWNQEFFTQRGDEYNTLGRGYTLVQEFVPGDAWTERMTTAQASGTAPDTYVMAYNGIISAADKKTIQPIDDLIPAEGLNDILTNVREMVSYDGKVYAYPQLIEPSTVLYYRTDLFQAAGLTEPPKTWDQLIEYAKLLQNNEVFGLGIPGFGDMGWSTWGWQQSAAGHLAINDNWDAPTLDAGYRELAELWKRMYDEGVVPEQPLSAYADIKGFGEGGLAMAFCGSWGIAGLINTYPDVADKFAVAPVPTKDGNLNKTTATNGGWTYVIDANAKNPQGAGNYISWLLAEDPATCGEFFKVAQFSKSAPRKSVQEWVNAQAGDSDWAAAVNLVAANAMPEPVYPWDISVAVSLMFENAATGAMSVDDAMKQAEDTIKDIITNQELAGKNPRK